MVGRSGWYRSGTFCVELLSPSLLDSGIWVPVARVGPPKGDTFPVEWLVDPAIPGNEVMVQAPSKELNFYLIEKREPDPWRYAIYHCRTGAIMYL
jgi:hypothetical protein